jgi:hypothetical protein
MFYTKSLLVKRVSAFVPIHRCVLVPETLLDVAYGVGNSRSPDLLSNADSEGYSTYADPNSFWEVSGVL